VHDFAQATPGAASSMSLFELPVSRGARATRLGLLLALDVLLAAAGVYLFVAYLAAREQVEAPAPPPAPATPARASVEPLSPIPQPSPSLRAHPDPLRESIPGGHPRPGGRPRPLRETIPGGQPKPIQQPLRASIPGGDPLQASIPGGDPLREPIPGGDPLQEPGHPAAVEPAAQDDEVEAGNMTRALSLAVDAHQPQLHRCYERAAKATSTADPLEGTIVLHFTLVPGGRFERVSAVSNETGSPQLVACVVALVEAWTVPPGPSGPLDFEWPFRFRATGATGGG
jgi:hypothetical protein